MLKLDGQTRARQETGITIDGTEVTVKFIPSCYALRSSRSLSEALRKTLLGAELASSIKIVYKILVPVKNIASCKHDKELTQFPKRIMTITFTDSRTSLVVVFESCCIIFVILLSFQSSTGHYLTIFNVEASIYYKAPNNKMKSNTNKKHKSWMNLKSFILETINKLSRRGN